MSAVDPGSPHAFDSGLTIPDFAACLSMGVEPLGLVQGYFCGQISNWSNYSYDAGYYYPCACYETGPHNQGWVGQVQALDDAWMEAHRTALSRMLNEAASLGAHGVVGVKTDISHPTNENSCEVHLYGTAVVVANAAPPQPVVVHSSGRAQVGQASRDRFCTQFSRLQPLHGRNGRGLLHGVLRVGPLRHGVRDLAAGGRPQAGPFARAIEGAAKMSPDSSLYDVRMEVAEAERYRNTYVMCSLLGSLVRRARLRSACHPAGAYRQPGLMSVGRGAAGRRRAQRGKPG